MEKDIFNWRPSYNPISLSSNPKDSSFWMNWPIWQCLLFLAIIVISIVSMILFLINIRELQDTQLKISQSLFTVSQSTINQESLLIENGYYSKSKCIGNNESLIFNIYSEFCNGNLSFIYPFVLSQYQLIGFKPEIENLILNGSVILEPICLTTLKEVIFFLYSNINNTNYLPNLCLFSSSSTTNQSNLLFYPTQPIQYIVDEFFNKNVSFYSLQNDQKYTTETIQAKIGRSFLKYNNNSLIRCFLTEVYCIYEYGGPIYVYHASII